jgi:hypothetical protein
LLLGDDDDDDDDNDEKKDRPAQLSVSAIVIKRG